MFPGRAAPVLFRQRVGLQWSKSQWSHWGKWTSAAMAGHGCMKIYGKYIWKSMKRHETPSILGVKFEPSWKFPKIHESAYILRSFPRIFRATAGAEVQRLLKMTNSSWWSHGWGAQLCWSLVANRNIQIHWLGVPDVFYRWIYGYGSIPINTIFRGMNIHLPAILMFTRGTRFWPIPIYRECIPVFPKFDDSPEPSKTKSRLREIHGLRALSFLKDVF